MKKHLQVLAASLLFGQLFVTQPAEAAAPLQGAVSETTVTTTPYEASATVPCALGGLGEEIDLSGTLRTVLHTTFDANGGSVSVMNLQSQDITGVGSVSGDTYRQVGTGRSSISFHGISMNQTGLLTAQLIGPGPDNNLVMRFLIHIAVNANGQVTADVFNSSAECR